MKLDAIVRDDAELVALAQAEQSILGRVLIRHFDAEIRKLDAQEPAIVADGSLLDDFRVVLGRRHALQELRHVINLARKEKRLPVLETVSMETQS